MKDPLFKIVESILEENHFLGLNWKEAAEQLSRLCLVRLRQQGLILSGADPDLREHILESVRDILLKKTYGHFNVGEYQSKKLKG